MGNNSVSTVPPRVRNELEKVYNEAMVMMQEGNLTNAVVHCRKGYKAAWKGYSVSLRQRDVYK